MLSPRGTLPQGDYRLVWMVLFDILKLAFRMVAARDGGMASQRTSLSGR